MRFFIPTGISVIVTLVFFSAPETAVADGFVTCQGLECNACYFVQMVNEIIQWIIMMFAVVAAILLAVAGVGLITSGGDQSALEKAKSTFTNVVIGLVIVLASWMIINVIMQMLTGQGLKFWGSLTNCGALIQPIPGQFRAGASADDPGAAAVADAADAGSLIGGLNHEVALSSLGDDFTVVSSGKCINKSNSTCTSLDGVRPLTIARARELQAAVGEQLVVTGGTEVGHSTKIKYSHEGGYKLDFRTTPKLTNHVINNYEKIGASTWRDPDGNTYYRHGASTGSDHWDVTFTR